MQLKRTTSPYPASDFITVAEAAFAVKGDATYDSDFLTRAITSAIKRAEDYCERAFINQTWTMTLRNFPSETNDNPLAGIYLPRGVAQSITSFSYLNSDGDSTALVADTDYHFDNSHNDYGVLVPTKSSGGWPTLYGYKNNEVTVTWVAGWGSSLPTDREDIKTAVLLDIGMMYQVRQILTPQRLYENPAWKMMLNDSKIYFDFSINDV